MNSNERKQFLGELHTALSKAFGPRFRGLVLFGSEARGDARPDSDIDILVLLAGKINLLDDLLMIARVILPVEWDREPHRIIDATPVSFEDYKAGKWALYRIVQREGIAA